MWPANVADIVQAASAPETLALAAQCPYIQYIVVPALSSFRCCKLPDLLHVVSVFTVESEIGDAVEGVSANMPMEKNPCMSLSMSCSCRHLLEMHKQCRTP
jgi:hypothetical protein